MAVINATFPALALKRDEVTLVHRGIVPAAIGNASMWLPEPLARHRSRSGRSVSDLIFGRRREVHDRPSCRRARGRHALPQTWPIGAAMQDCRYAPAGIRIG